MKKLSKDEMKKVMGGVMAPPEGDGTGYMCRCTGSIGEWVYPGGDPGATQTNQDIQDYCRSGQGKCGWGGWDY